VSAEPDLERGVLQRGLQTLYGLTLEHITFLGLGTAHAYRAAGSSQRYFVKLVPRGGYGAGMLERVTAEAPLLCALQPVLQRVPKLLPTLEGADVGEIAGYNVLVYDWIDARNVEDDWVSALPELAPMLGQVHARSAEIVRAVPRLPMPPEDFALPFEAAFVEDLRALDHDPRDSVRALRDLLQPHRADLERLLARTRGFQRAALEGQYEFVVCHTDAHGGNVMRDANGALWIIDWETARLAPPEHDLWMLGAHLGAVLPQYVRGLGREVRLNADLLGFYACRRVLEDLALDVGMVVHENTRPEDDANNLMVIHRHILPSLQAVHDDVNALTLAASSQGA
jgi:Ser/Thr protein kinase RdoA (MazF antagonist)